MDVPNPLCWHHSFVAVVSHASDMILQKGPQLKFNHSEEKAENLREKLDLL